MFGTGKIISRLDDMLTDAINGTFTESRYDETELSRLESKFRQYLTGKELATEKVEKERAAIKELVTDISHQTKTPLANICLYTQLLEEASDEKTLPYVRQIRLQAEKLDFLIRTLTKISRLESDMIRLRPEPRPVLPMVEQAVREARGQAEAKAVAIQVMPVHETGYLCGSPDTDQAAASLNLPDADGIRASYDARWTKEALGNLLDNAVKYSPASRAVTVFVKAMEMFVCILVDDEGPGIPEEERAQIFERFYRGKNAAPEEGNGVGLYLTRMILQREGGYVKVSSGKNGGSRFCMYLPRA